MNLGNIFNRGKSETEAETIARKLGEINTGEFEMREKCANIDDLLKDLEASMKAAKEAGEIVELERPDRVIVGGEAFDLPQSVTNMTRNQIITAHARELLSDLVRNGGFHSRNVRQAFEMAEAFADMREDLTQPMTPPPPKPKR